MPSHPNNQPQTLNQDALNSLLAADHGDPFSILGPHQNHLLVIRPDAQKVELIRAGRDPRPLNKIDDRGLFAIETQAQLQDYQLRFTPHQGQAWTMADPYSFPPLLGDQDLHYLSEGSDLQLHKKLGAHLTEIDGVKGVRFALWAPNARRVSVIGDWNNWDGRTHPMRKRYEAGIWELFIPGIQHATHYQYEVLGADNQLRKKGDPYGNFHQSQGQTASLVWERNRHDWQDQDWMNARPQQQPWNQAISIYEFHPGSWQRVPEQDNRPLSWREMAPKLIGHVKKLGFTHVELMPITEYPFDGSWGYQVTGYFAPTSRHGTPEDFKHFVDQLHQAGIGVLLDWVPAHFPKDQFGLARFDGTALYEHADPREGEHKDWGTLIFNFGRNEVRNFLINSALYWLQEYHIDGLRVDAVASMLYRDYSREAGEWVPNRHGGRENLEAIDFLRELNHTCYSQEPGILMIAEESTAWGGVSHPVDQGGLGFGFKWNMGWMNDTLAFIERDPIHRSHHLGDATFSMIYSFDENFILVLSHDEVVHGKQSLLHKMPGDDWQQFANLRLLYAWMWTHPGKKLLFMGSEFGMREEWSESQSLPWHYAEAERHGGITSLLSQLNHHYQQEPALHQTDYNPEKFYWIEANDTQHSVLAYIRHHTQDTTTTHILTVINLTPSQQDHYTLGVPCAGEWQEILNTDASHFGGSGKGNQGQAHTQDHPSHGHPQSLNLLLPGLSVLILKHQS